MLITAIASIVGGEALFGDAVVGTAILEPCSITAHGHHHPRQQRRLREKRRTAC